MNTEKFRLSLTLTLAFMLTIGLLALLSQRRAADAAAPVISLSPNGIADVEWERVYGGVLDGVARPSLYWGGATNSHPTFADIDDDGDLDAFLGSNRGLHFFRNDGTAAAPAWVYVSNQYINGQENQVPAFADVDGDGDLDLFLGQRDSIALYRNTGTANSPIWQYVTDNYAGISLPNQNTAPTLADIDTDGDLDLFVAHYQWEDNVGRIRFYRNDGSAADPNWTLVSDQYNSITSTAALYPTFADIDDDGDLDLFVGDHDHIRYYKNSGGTLSPAWTWITDTYAGVQLWWSTHPAFADLNDDGNLDLLAGHDGGWVVHYENTGTPSAATWALVTNDTFPLDRGYWIRPALADIDDDGDLDLFLGTDAGNRIIHLRNDGTLATPLWTHVTDQYAGISLPDTPPAPALADIDDDGDLDLFVGGRDVGTIRFYENTASALPPVWTWITDAYAGIDTGNAALPTFADIDGDDDLDLFVASGGTLAFYRNDGDASAPVWTWVSDAYGDSATIISGDAAAFADVDGDGDLDLFTDRYFYRNDGDVATPAWQRDTFIDMEWSGGPPILGDLLENDGRPDLILGGPGGITLHRNLGDLPPQVSGVSPSAGGTGLPAGLVAVNFSDAMSTTTLVAANVSVVGSASGPMGGELRYDPAARQLIFKPLGAFSDGETVQVTLKAAITDETDHGLDGDGDGVSEGSPTDDYTWSFTAQNRQNLVVCQGQEPSTLYVYGSSMLAQAHVLAAIYDGPIDNTSFDYQPVILTQLPSPGNGLEINDVTVSAGDWVVDDNGDPIALTVGTRVRPAGCYSTDCAVEFDGSPLQMEQMQVAFELIQGLKWSDGVTLTADDSVYSFELAKHPDTPASKYFIDRTASYTATDDTTTVWTGLPGYRDSTFFTRFWAPLPEHAWGHLTPAELLSADESSRRPLGWGPYVVDEWVSGDHITLHKNSHYWRADEGLPRFDALTYRFVDEDSSANIAALLSGECDVVDRTANLSNQSAYLIELEGQGLVNPHFQTGTVLEHADLGIDPVASYDRPDFFEDARTRRAIAMCMDRQKVVDEVTFGHSQVLHTYLPAEHPLFNADAARYPFDVAAGSALLEAVGWTDDDGNPATPRVALGVAGVPDGTLLEFYYWTTNALERQQATQVLGDSLAQCGIKVNLEYWNSLEFFTDGPEGPIFGRHFDIGQFAWQTGFTPGCSLYLCSEIPSEENGWGKANDTGFCNAEYDAACNAALQSLPGTTEYVNNHMEAQRILAEQMPAVPLYLRLNLAVSHPRLLGLRVDPTQGSEMYNIEEWDLLLDGLPPEGDLQASDGGQTSNATALTLHLSAADYGGGNVSRMLLRERAWNGTDWDITNKSGWMNYAAAYPWTLDTTPGAHYVNAYLMDDSGNVSQLPTQTVVNYTPSSTPILTREMHVYRVRVEAGEDFTATLTTSSGDSDLYVWAPGSEGEPDAYSNQDGTALDQVVVADAIAGDYHIEVHGYAASSTYHLDLDAPSLTLSRLLAWLRSLTPQAATVKVIPAAPLTTEVPDDDPAEAPGGLPNTIMLRTPLSVLSPGGYESQITTQVWDHKGKTVADDTTVTFTTTLGSFVSSGSSTVTATTTDGLARATLLSGDQAGNAIITAATGAAQKTLNVLFRWPHSLYLPMVLRGSL